jgi:hypothetical protein
MMRVLELSGSPNVRLAMILLQKSVETGGEP